MNTLTYGLLAGVMMMSTAAYAEGPGKDMSPEQRKEHFEAKKAEWEAMSDKEKVAKIEERREEFLKEREKEWNSKSDQEKIKFAEEMRKKHGGPDGHHGGKGPKGGERPQHKDAE